MIITNVKYHKGQGGFWMTCSIDGRSAYIPLEQKPTLTETKCLFVSFDDGGEPPVLVVEEGDVLAQGTSERRFKNLIRDDDLFAEYLKFTKSLRSV